MADEDAADRDFQRTAEFMEYIAEVAHRLAHRGGGRVA
jgi:pterin-4a-carbinolamine dehydratase